MECDEHLTKFQGALLSLSKKGLLSNPPDGSQAEDLKKYEIKELSNFVANLPDFAKCKIAYYMILNTDVTVSEDLKNDEFIGLFVNITPLIPLQALIKWIDILGLIKEFCKVIENSPSALGEELCIAVVRNTSFLGIINFYFPLWSSIFKKIYKIEKQYCLESPGKLIYCFKIISQRIEECLDMRNVTYKNLCILQEFLITILCIISYCKNQEPDDEMYKLSIELKVTNCIEVPNEECINFVFKTIYNILKTLNFDEWNSSSSYLEEWKTIRNLTDKLLKEVNLVNVPADVLDILLKLAVNESHAAIESLILDAKQGQKCNWTRDIINPGVIECNECPFHRMNDDDLNVLLEQAFENLETSGEEMKELFLAAVTVSHNQYKWLETFFNKYKPNLLTTSNTCRDLTESFNRISNIESVPLNVIIPLCMQSPVGTIKKLVQLAISTRAANLHIFQVLKPACQVMLPTGVTVLSHVILCLLSEELTSVEEKSFPCFIAKLMKQNLVGCAFFEDLIKRLKEFLDKNEMDKAVLCLTVMNSILVQMEPPNKVPLLMFMSQVLGHFSWDLGSFSAIKANGRDAVCSIVGQLMAKLDYNTNRGILNRTREEILKCWEVNQACFCDLWFRFGKIWHGSGKFDSVVLALIHSSSCRRDLRQFLLTFGPLEEVRTSIVLALNKVLPLLTLNLWDKVFTDLKDIWKEMNPSGSCTGYEIFRMFLSVWYLLTLQLNTENNIHSCYKHCLAGFGRLFSCTRLEGEFLVRTYEEILFIMKSIEDKEIRKSCLVNLLPVLKDRLASASKEGAKAHFYEIGKILSEEFNN